jgi:hypothetical protein
LPSFKTDIALLQKDFALAQRSQWLVWKGYRRVGNDVRSAFRDAEEIDELRSKS